MPDDFPQVATALPHSRQFLARHKPDRGAGRVDHELCVLARGVAVTFAYERYLVPNQAETKETIAPTHSPASIASNSSRRRPRGWAARGRWCGRARRSCWRCGWLARRWRSRPGDSQVSGKLGPRVGLVERVRVLSIELLDLLEGHRLPFESVAAEDVYRSAGWRIPLTQPVLFVERVRGVGHDVGRGLGPVVVGFKQVEQHALAIALLVVSHVLVELAPGLVKLPLLNGNLGLLVPLIRGLLHLVEVELPHS